MFSNYFQDTDDYRAFGKELKSLLTEMRELVAEKKMGATYAQKASLHRRSKPPVQSNINIYGTFKVFETKLPRIIKRIFNSYS
jgi:hypothetical protein